MANIKKNTSRESQLSERLGKLDWLQGNGALRTASRPGRLALSPKQLMLPIARPAITQASINVTVPMLYRNAFACVLRMSVTSFDLDSRRPFRVVTSGHYDNNDNINNNKMAERAHF